MSIEQTEYLIAQSWNQFLKHPQPDHCSFMEWLDAQQGREDTLQLVREIVARPEWNPKLAFETLIRVSEYWTGELLEADQIIHAEYICALPPGKARVYIERILEDFGDRLTPGCWRVFVGWLEREHPNPKKFLARDHVLDKIPEAVNLSRVRAPDFPELEGRTIRGRRKP